MDKLIKLYMDGNKSKSIYTEKTFIQNIKRIEFIIKLDVNEWDKKSFNNYNIILDELLNDYSLNSIINTINTIIFYLKSVKADEKIINKYIDILNDLADERKKEEFKQEASNKELSNWINYNDMKKKIEELSIDYIKHKKAFTVFRNFLIFSLYILSIPVRIQNYLNMKVIKNEDSNNDSDHNYLIKDKEGYKMIFNKYKTSKYIGRVEINIENEILIKLIDRWFKMYNKIESNNDKFFLINKNEEEMTQNNFSSALKSISKRIFNKEISVNDIRHIFLTDFLSSNRTIEEKIKVAQIMGQTYKPSRMELYQRKNIS